MSEPLREALAARLHKAQTGIFLNDECDTKTCDHGDDALVLLNVFPELRAGEAIRSIAALSDEDVRDYEQGLCFFCGRARGSMQPGPRGRSTAMGA